MKQKLTLISLAISAFFFSPIIHAEVTAPVSGFTRDFITAKPITDGHITILETGTTVTTDSNGNFGPIQWPVGKPITFVMDKLGYRTTQTATVIVPPEGLTSPYNNVTLQSVDIFTFYMLAGAMGRTLDENKCHMVTTITAFHKTLGDLPQGESDSVIALTPSTTEIPFYFGIYTDGPLKNYPNPFAKGLTQTSQDGGVVFANLDPSNTPYVMTAVKPGVSFSQAEFMCRKGIFINVSPPDGPTALS